jgi:serine/threonine protein phosphatase PrpC
MSTNSYYKTSVSPGFRNTGYSYNSGNQDFYGVGTSNYSTSSYKNPKTMFYHQYGFDEIDNGNLNSTNGTNVNNLNTGYNSYFQNSKYSTKTNNPSNIRTNPYSFSNTPKLTARKSHFMKIVTPQSTIIPQSGQNTFNNITSNYSTTGKTSNVEEIKYPIIVDETHASSSSLQVIDNNNEEENDLDIFLKKQGEVNSGFFSNTQSIRRENPHLTNSARFASRTFDLNNNIMDNIQTNTNIRFSEPMKINLDNSSQYLNNQTIHPALTIKNGEIINKNNAKEYYKESKGGLVKSYAYCEDPNKGNRDYMEDQAKSIENFNGDTGKILFCIFDGHGGGEVSKYLQEYFPVFMKKMMPFTDPFADFTRLFKAVDEKIKILNVPGVGSTATIVYIERVNGKKILYCANVGDSRCVLVNRKGIMRLSYDDRVDDPKEKNRIIRQGGIIINNRVSGRIMLSRSFGDWVNKQDGVIVDPHLTKIELNDNDLYLIIASDGVWDVIKDEECKGFTEIYTNTSDICKNLVQECLNRGSEDNISCYVINF